ncbi:hydrolethalus syndrome protein 1 homolog isoform X2 [Tribolium madens]|uniref:hydrolethalus syndrome protein 1 homolog isoform X2 n=1 Tax=Tribolium madens TaxID=41895 RepID=UPI001CF73133|nr:hydrolethalus syndrome protein 1 homolog isoform X2 [Tribolium madens]
MATKISPREVLEYLNDLGYHNVNPQQLKEFVYDLKKLIKYEERKRREQSIENTSVPKESRKDSKDDVFVVLHSQGTHSSRAKIVPKKESVISLKIKTSKASHHCQETTTEPQTAPRKSTEDSLDFVPVKDVPAKKVTSSHKPKVIRPAVQTNKKNDPVALYHQYQMCWKRQKIPGEDNRTDLRWAIREKMMSGPKVTRA